MPLNKFVKRPNFLDGKIFCVLKVEDNIYLNHFYWFGRLKCMLLGKFNKKKILSLLILFSDWETFVIYTTDRTDEQIIPLMSSLHFSLLLILERPSMFAFSLWIYAILSEIMLLFLLKDHRLNEVPGYILSFKFSLASRKSLFITYKEDCILTLVDNLRTLHQL